MMTIATQLDPAGPVTLALTGKCSGGGLGELRRAIDRARRMGKQIVIDLGEVTLMDRPSLEFLASQMQGDVQLINCPEYIAPWIRNAGPGLLGSES